jgi:hypothetical protein
MGRPRKIHPLPGALDVLPGGPPQPPPIPATVPGQLYKHASEVMPANTDCAVLAPLYRTRIVGARVVRAVRQVERPIACPECGGRSYPDEAEPYLCGGCHGAGVRALVETVIEVAPAATSQP